MNNINLQNNQSTCIQTQNQITGTTYVNICTNQRTFVPYGTGDWLMFGFSIVLLIGMFIFFLREW